MNARQYASIKLPNYGRKVSTLAAPSWKEWMRHWWRRQLFPVKRKEGRRGTHLFLFRQKVAAIKMDGKQGDRDAKEIGRRQGSVPLSFVVSDVWCPTGILLLLLLLLPQWVSPLSGNRKLKLPGIKVQFPAFRAILYFLQQPLCAGKRQNPGKNP
jgi:hypothetical protein